MGRRDFRAWFELANVWESYDDLNCWWMVVWELGKSYLEFDWIFELFWESFNETLREKIMTIQKKNYKNSEKWKNLKKNSENI